MRRGLQLLGILLMILALLPISCKKEGGRSRGQGEEPLRVVATLFPLYDFAKNVGGKRADVSLLVPPGVEPHSFEPRPADIIRLNKADIFIYTNISMEPWAGSILKGVNNPGLIVVDTSRGVPMIEESSETEAHDHDQEHRHETMDPHIWLDFSNAEKMVDNIRDGFIKKDPAHSDYYRENAESYKAKLAELDKRYSAALSHCEKDIIVSGGHFTFGYLARKYHLRYISAYGFSPNAEPTPRDLAHISDVLKRNGLHYLFFEELITPRVAEAIAGETGASLLMLNGAHNISRDELEKGVAFLSLMEKNLQNLRIGLQCR